MINKKPFVALILAMTLGAVMVPACKKSQAPSDSSQKNASMKVLYQCPMHPQIVSDKPGDCPICHMKLARIEVKATEGENATAAPAQTTGDGSQKSSSSKVIYQCPMHPQIVSDNPGDCSICHMKLERREVPPGDGRQSAVPGQATVHLAADVEHRIGVKVTEVNQRDLVLPIRASARVAYDPQLYSAALEHQEAVKFLTQARKEGGAGVDQAEATVRSSTLRLRQMGLSNGQISQIASPGYDPSSLLVGSKGEKVWVYADVSDNQAPSVKPGQSVELTSTALPGKTFTGTVGGIDPIVNAESRTVRVRVLIANTEGQLRSGIFLNALIYATLGKALTVPESAVLDTGARQLVYVQIKPGEFQPRVVHLGRQGEGYVEVLSGLQSGEKVVSSANFLIDSESKIQSAAQESGK